MSALLIFDSNGCKPAAKCHFIPFLVLADGAFLSEKKRPHQQRTQLPYPHIKNRLAGAHMTSTDVSDQWGAMEKPSIKNDLVLFV